MKTTHAVILIIVCIVIAIVGLNALMNAHAVAVSSSNKVNANDDPWEGIDRMMDRWDGVQSTPKTDPRLIPATMLIAGLIGIGYGAYCVATNLRSR